MYLQSSDRFTFFVPPYIEFGAGKRGLIPRYASRLGMRKALLVVDPFFTETAHLGEIESGLADAGVETTVWSGVVPDPTDVSVDEAASTFRKHDCAGVICIGGGSAMDTGKSAAAVVGSGSQSIREHMPPSNKPVASMAPTICVPTTAGTGAEANPYAMVTNTETHQKVVGYPAWDLLSAQRVAIVDPELTVSMPPNLTASTGIDAFCQALECYLTKRPNPVSDDLALRAVHLVYQSLRRAVYDGQDLSARADMSLAALLSTMAFPNAGLSYPHMLSSVMADVYHLQHGVAVGAVLVAALEVLLPLRTERLARVATVLGEHGEGRSPRQLAIAGISGIRQLLEDVGFPTLSEATKSSEVDVADFLKYVELNMPSLAASPGEMERVERILIRSLQF